MDAKFQCSYSTIDTTELMEHVIPHYAIDDPIECLLWERGANDTYQVRCASGLYYLRVFRCGAFTRDANEFEAEALIYLHQQGYPVAFPIARKSGGYTTEIAAPEGPRFILLSTLAEGTVPDYDVLENCRLVGKSIAEMHIAANGFKTSRKRNQLDLQWMLDDSMTVIRDHIAKRPSANHAKVLRLVEDIATDARAAVMAVPEESLDFGICHGDFHGGNLHLHEGKVTQFDFEECAFGFRIYDLATYKWDLGFNEPRIKRWPVFLEGYESVRPLSESELSLIDTFVILRELTETAYGIRHVKDFGHNCINASDIDAWGEELKHYRKLQST